VTRVCSRPHQNYFTKLIFFKSPNCPYPLTKSEIKTVLFNLFNLFFINYIKKSKIYIFFRKKNFSKLLGEDPWKSNFAGFFTHIIHVRLFSNQICSSYKREMQKKKKMKPNSRGRVGGTAS
jgi:hypothetical protein